MSEIAQAYAEMDYILKYVPADMNVKVPQRIKDLISTKKDPNYVVKIDNRVPLHQQKLLKTTKSLIALLYYNYWCIDQKEKDELKQRFIENDKIARENRNKDKNISNAGDSNDGNNDGNPPTTGFGGTSTFTGMSNNAGSNTSAQMIVESETKQVVLETAEEKRIGFNIQESAIDSTQNLPTIDQVTQRMNLQNIQQSKTEQSLVEIKRSNLFKKLKGFFARLFGTKIESFD